MRRTATSKRTVTMPRAASDHRMAALERYAAEPLAKDWRPKRLRHDGMPARRRRRLGVFV